MISLVRCALQKPFEGVKSHLPVLVLAAYFLQAEDIRIKPDKLRTQDRDSLIKAWFSIASVVEVHQVEGGDSKLSGHEIILVVALQLIWIIFLVTSDSWPMYRSLAILLVQKSDFRAYEQFLTFFTILPEKNKYHFAIKGIVQNRRG